MDKMNTEHSVSNFEHKLALTTSPVCGSVLFLFSPHKPKTKFLN